MTDPRPYPPHKNTWMRTNGPLSDRLSQHQAVLAYLSDMDFMSTSMLPHGRSPAGGDTIQGASLDHSLWFHRPFRADEWLLFEKGPRTPMAPGDLCEGTSTLRTAPWWPRPCRSASYGRPDGVKRKG